MLVGRGRLMHNRISEIEVRCLMTHIKIRGKVVLSRWKGTKGKGGAQVLKNKKRVFASGDS